ncbi:acyltransferase family protein [Brachybacterium sacelli]|uniref:Fucose 4-O-acetylase-like acetyltransferase n=1 Tax=Brachybacterium sacelli TaxID=173364 RepID=A0ABS4X6T3_9MICO|nr:acyltransferase family protein [Brachybacterium sacelli]MBP2384145.1 fucose 4-O-acetylase-like acetyltransferase [Brachybacterium sacelli]
MADADPRSPRPDAPQAGTAVPPTAAGKKPRDPFLDNARGILITLVVIGHTLECFDGKGDYLGGAIHTWIYSFHMAAFVAISGFLSRSYRNEPRQVRRLLTAMAVPYLIFQMLHEVGKTLLLGQEFHLQFTSTAWTLWFLLALLMWRLATPVLRALRYPLVFAVAIAVIAPLDPGLDGTFTLGRFFEMMPFFVLGLVTTPEMLQKLKTMRHRVWIGVLVLVGALAFSFATHEMFSVARFFLRGSYADGPYETPVAIIMQVLVLAAGMIGTVALLLATPLGETFWTALGARSLTIYLLHPLVLLPIRYVDEPFAWVENWWAPLVLVVIGLAITAVLSRRIVATVTSWVTDPPIGNLLVKDEDAASRGQRRTV